LLIHGCIKSEKAQKQTDEIARLKIELSDCGHRETAANDAIERQNTAIEKVRVDTVFITKSVNNIVEKYSIVRDSITIELEKDDSYEKALYALDNIMRSFHGLRP
jgi:hypothetical protein